MLQIDYSVAQAPLHHIHACGDIAVIKELDDKLFVGVVDVLGSGEEAREVALRCEQFLQRNCHVNLVELVHGLHRHIRGPRGAVVGLCLLDLQTSILKHVGIGDIAARTFGAKSSGLVSRPGIVGYQMGTPREETRQLSAGDVLVLCTDGIRAHFHLDDYPGILYDDAETIAAGILERFSRQTDDALCAAVRCTS